MQQLSPALATTLGTLLLLGLVVYGWVISRVWHRGGKVSSAEFKDPDSWVCCGFIVWFMLTIAQGFGAPQQHDVSEMEILRGAGLFAAIVIGLGLFMQWRGINPLRQFGITRRNVFFCIAAALGLILAAYPAILLTENLTAIAMHGKAEPQNVVEFFVNASRKSETRAVYLMLGLAVIVAPAAEETIFRGYLYGVLKRHVGPFVAALFSSALFAAMHLNVSALPALFVLALCLTLAYEATGSLLVNMFMHGIFNLSMLLVMLTFARHPNAL